MRLIRCSQKRQEEFSITEMMGKRFCQFSNEDKMVGLYWELIAKKTEGGDSAVLLGWSGNSMPLCVDGDISLYSAQTLLSALYRF